jgi:light-regulated signal transduction histidine kinase (bacteriophytochrome)
LRSPACLPIKTGQMQRLAIDTAPGLDALGRLEDLLRLLPDEHRAEADAALAAARGAAVRTEAERLELLYVASHDLTEPLRMVTSYLKLLERRAGPAIDDRGREYMFYAVDGAERMKGLIDDLVRYSRVDNCGPESTVVHLDTLLAEVVRDLGPAIEEAGATVEAEGLLPSVSGDRQQLRQLLQNLISNGVKFRRPGHGNRVRIAATRVAGEDAWELTVSDDGIGIDGTHADRIWRVFERLHSREQFAGSGIGLALCRRIAERHGGRIWVTPARGGGSVFHVLLQDQAVAALGIGECA